MWRSHLHIYWVNLAMMHKTQLQKILWRVEIVMNWRRWLCSHGWGSFHSHFMHINMRICSEYKKGMMLSKLKQKQVCTEVTHFKFKACITWTKYLSCHSPPPPFLQNIKIHQLPSEKDVLWTCDFCSLQSKHIKAVIIFLWYMTCIPLLL
jgi:hypothetical protein